MTDTWAPSSEQASQAGALTSLDENPDEAARAYHLSKDTGIPAEAIHGNLEESETQYKGALVGHLLKNNKYLQDYVNSHPLAGAISNDDYGQLDKISQALGKIGPIGVMQEAVKGFKEHYDTGDLGSYISDKDWEEHPIASTAVTIAGTGFEVGGRILSAGLAGLHAGTVKGLQQFGMEESSAERLARDITGEFERRVQSGEGLHGAQEHVAAAKAAEPYVKAGDVPPVGLDPIIDKLHEDQAKADLKALDEVHKEVQASTTYERAPELTKAFIQQHIGQAKIGITADEVAKLYGEKQPHPEDGILGFVPDLASQLKVALASGGDVEVPLADWLAHVDPEVAKELHDHLRLRKGGMTLEESKVISQQLAVEAKPEDRVDLYHGTTEEGFESLSPDFARNKYEKGVFFSDKPEVASDYAEGEGGRVFPASIAREDLYKPTPEEIQQFMFKGDYVQQSIEKAKELGKAGVHFELGGDNIFAISDTSRLRYRYTDQAVASVRKAAGLEPQFDQRGKEGQQQFRKGEWVPTGKKVHAFVPEEFTKHEEALSKLVDDEIARLAPKGVGVERAIKIQKTGTNIEAGGVYTQFKDKLPIILYALKGDPDPIGVGRHEVIHHLRAYGFFDDAEWATLEKAAKEEGWLDKPREGARSSVRDRYKDLPEEHQLEEAIADEFRYWNRNPDSPTLAAKIFQKLREFLQKVKEKYEFYKTQNPEVQDIFAKIESGEVGSREPTGPRHPQAFKPDQFSEKQPELPGTTRQEDLSTFKPSAVGLTGRQMQKVMDLIAELNKEDQAYQQKKIEKLERAKQTTEWKEHEAEMRDEVENDLASRPDIALSNFLRSGLLYGESTGRRPRIDPRQLTPEQRAAFPEKYQRRDGMAPEDIANLFGYPSVDAMVAGIAKLEGDMATVGETRLGEFTRKLAAAETDRRMVEKYGDLEENILREAQEHVVSPTQMDLLHEETVALGMQNGWEMPFTKEEVKAGTKEAFGEMPASGVSMEKFLKDSGKAGKLAQLALLEGNATEFFKQRQRQEYALRYADEAKRFAKDQERFERTAKRFSSREVAGVLPEYTNFVHDILGRVSRPVKRSVQDLADAIDRSGYKDIEHFVTSKEGDLREVPVADFLLDPSFRKPLGEMSVSDYRAVADSVKTLVHNGRNELKIIREGDAADLQEIKNGMMEQLETFPEKDISVTQEAGKGFKYAAKTAWAALLQIEALFRRWDRGDRDGLFTKYISRPLADASNNFASLERQYGAKLRELKDGVKLDERVNNTIFREPTAGGYGELMTFNRSNLRAVLRYVGRPVALDKLAKGYGLRPEQIMDWLNQNAKKEDWDWASKQGKIFDEVFKEASKMYERLTGVAPEKSETAPVQTPFGTYDGWYHPISYDPRFPGKSKKLMGGDALEQNNYIRATTPAGYTKKVTGYNAPLNLDLANTAEHLRGMLHDIAYREAVIESSKIFYDSSFQRTVNKHYGQQYQKLLVPYLRDVANVANFNSEAQAIGSRVSEFMRQNIIGALIGFNPGTVMKHGATAWVNSMNQVGGVRFLSAVKDMFQKDEVTGERNWSFALENSEELQRRHRNYIETMRGSEGEALGESSWREMMLRGGAWTVSKADLASAVPTWLAEYRHSMEDGRTHGEAVGDGNAAVRQAHGSSVITNRPAAMRGGQAAQWMTSLYGFFSHMLNKQYEMMWRSREMFGKFDEGEYAKAAADLPRITNMFFAYVAFPALIEELVTPMTNDEHESMLSWTGKTLAKGVSSSWPIIRDLAHAALSINNTEPSVGLFTTAAKTAIDVIRDMKDVKHKFSKEQAGKTLQHGITAFGALTGLANQQEGRVARFMYNMYTGQERPKGPWQFLVGLRYGQTKGHSKSFAEYMNSMIGGRR